MFALVLAGCGGGGSATPVSPPPVAGAWKLESAADAPKPVLTGVTRSWKAVFTGPRRFEVEMHHMSGDGLAFEAVQKWRPETGKMVVHGGMWFAVVNRGDAGREESMQFARALEAALR